MSGKKRTSISAAQSSLILKIYEECDGNWERILNIQEIKDLRMKKETLQNHVKYIRKKKNQKKGTQGTEHRQQIIEQVQQILDKGQKVQDVPLDFGDDIEQDTPEREASLSPREKLLDEIDKAEMSESVPSSSISSSNDFKHYQQQERERKKMRTSSVQRKEEERKEIVEQIRKEKEQAHFDSEFRKTMNTFIMTMLHNLNQEEEKKKYKKKRKKMEQRITNLEKGTDEIKSLLQQLLKQREEKV
jgi:hypothetical protein